MHSATASPALAPQPATDFGARARASATGLGIAATARRNQQTLHARSRLVAHEAERHGVGLWIDHRRAVIVFVAPGGANTTLVLSRVDKQPGRIAGLRMTEPFEPQQVPADDSRGRRYAGQLDLYYDAVIACIQNKGPILAFGPGEAKGELRSRLARNKHDQRVFTFETVDKMTGRQIAAKTTEWIAAAPVETTSARRRSGRPER